MQTIWCIGIPAFSTLPMWQVSARKRGLPYRPQTKGKVENGVKYVRGNFWPGLHFRDLEDLNAQALAWLNTTANPRMHGTTGEVPFTRLRLEGLQPATKAFSYDTSVMTTRRSSKDCLISYEGNLYSVPAAYARKALQVNITEAGELVICSQNAARTGSPSHLAWEAGAERAG